MKFIAATLSTFALLGKVSHGCYIFRNYGTGASVDSANLGDFNVQAGQTSTCKLYCDTGNTVSLYLKYGDYASLLSNDGNSFDADSCGISVTISSPNEQFALGYTVKANDFSNLRIECTCTVAIGGGGACFSESTTVLTEDRGTVTMNNLEVGDKVYVGDVRGRPKFEAVYSFGHYHENKKETFLQIYTDTMSRLTPPLEMTGNHLIAVSGKQQPVRADSLQVGDILVHEDPENGVREGKVIKIGTVDKEGLYMPLTQSGSIVVGGIHASVYVSLTDEAPSLMETASMFGFTEERLLHWWLTPHRMLCLGVSSKFCGDKKDSNKFSKEEGILNWLSMGKNIVLDWADQRSAVVQIMVVGVPFVMIFGFLTMIEFLAGSVAAPTVLALMVGAGATALSTKFVVVRRMFFDGENNVKKLE